MQARAAPDGLAHARLLLISSPPFARMRLRGFLKALLDEEEIPMRPPNSRLKLVLLLCALVVCACGTGEDPTGSSTAGNAGLVTLKSPYAEWDWEKTGQGKLTVQNAAWAIGRQSGQGYAHDKSHDNTYPTCREWIRPSFKNKPWREALDEVLTPHGLTYFIEKNDIVLIRIEDAERRSRARKKISAAVSRFISSESEPRRLRDAVVVFPLSDSEGKTTALGALLSELGMMKATYGADKKYNLHVPSIITPSVRDLYSKMSLYVIGKTVSPKERERMLARFQAKSSVAGTLEVAYDGTFKVLLSFEGEHGSRDFSMGGTESDLLAVPDWIARCVNEYCQIEILPREQERLSMADLENASALFQLVGLETGYVRGRVDTAGWKSFLIANPDSMFALYRYYLVSKGENDDSLQYLAASHKKHGDHELGKFLEADWYHRAEEYQNSVPLFLKLLEDDSRNYALYERLADGLLALELSQSAAHLMDFWVKHDPDSYLSFLAKGDFYVNYAWQARGTGFANTVTEEGRKKFRDRLRVAEQCFIRAYQLNPTDPRAPTGLLAVVRGQSKPRAEMEDWYQKAIEADPRHYAPYKAKLTYLKPQWYGSVEEMFAFARECSENAPEESRVAMLILDAHHLMYYRSGDNKKQRLKYYGRPEVWQEIRTAYENFLFEHPNSRWDRNFLARHACYARDYEEAVRQFDIIGDDIEEECWESDKEFHSYKAKAYAKMEKRKKREESKNAR